MPDDTEVLLHRLIGGDHTAPAQITALAATSSEPALLVAAALSADCPDDLLHRAAQAALTTRDRQLVAITVAHLRGDEELLDALVRDHLADHPDNILAAWIAAQHPRPGRPATITRSGHA